MNQFNWDTSFQVDFDLVTGLSKTAETTKRYLSQMKDMYYDADAVNEVLKSGDPLVYEFHELGCPERAGDLAFGLYGYGESGGRYHGTSFEKGRGSLRAQALRAPVSQHGNCAACNVLYLCGGCRTRLWHHRDQRLPQVNCPGRRQAIRHRQSSLEIGKIL